MGRRGLLITAGTVLIVCGALAWLSSARSLLRASVELGTVAYVGSEACTACHDDRHASWQRTFHRTMTQDASASSVRGRFDGQELTAFGGVVRPVTVEGGYAFEYRDASTGAVQATLPVLRTVGSHRYQQYLTRDAGSETYYRLHYLWDIEGQRWVHMNAAFLGSDSQDFDAHVTTWNMNCVFCHNTGPRPQVKNLPALRERARAGEAVDMRGELRFDTTLGELGISCETCHGPAAEHVRRMQGIDLRWLATWDAGVDASIVNPDRLPAARANDVCGACHAGRTLADVPTLDRWLSVGPSFRPGDDLSEHVRVLDANVPSPSSQVPDVFRNRFWHDGSVRLTAYEYQGLNASACAKGGELSCIRCHSMHGGDPAGMLPAANRGDAPCLRCHQDLRTRIAEHSGHAAESAGARCIGCHMPRAVYGVMTIHRTHDISIPDVAASLAAGKPDACLNCHANEPPAFALRKDHKSALGVTRQEGGDLALADGLVALLAGDPVRQAVAAFELGRVDQVPGRDELLVRVPWLIAALRDDRPAIRRFAWKSLGSIDQALTDTPRALGLAHALAGFDFTGPADGREVQVQLLESSFAAVSKHDWPVPGAATALDADYRLDAAVLARLSELGARSDKQIDIGE